MINIISHGGTTVKIDKEKGEVQVKKGSKWTTSKIDVDTIQKWYDTWTSDSKSLKDIV